MIKFTCPNCNGNELEEISEGTIVSKITEVYEDESQMEYGECSHDAEVIRIQCCRCGWVVPDVLDGEDLFKFLKEKEA